jgi:biotin transport system substrate-specific component
MTIASTAVSAPSRPVGLKIAAAFAGALVVAAAAQVAIPIPGTVVPFTLQPLAVLIVGGLLGPQFGTLAMVMYLVMGAMGLPVWTPLGLPGLARLFGPTGGYLIAYPVAAWAVGKAVRRTRGQAPYTSRDTFTALPPYRLTALACLLGMAIIHAGGAAQLLILTGSASRAFAAGLLPFVANDLVKALVAALVIRRLLPQTRALS